MSIDMEQATSKHLQSRKQATEDCSINVNQLLTSNHTQVQLDHSDNFWLLFALSLWTRTTVQDFSSTILVTTNDSTFLCNCSLYCTECGPLNMRY